MVEEPLNKFPNGNVRVSKKDKIDMSLEKMIDTCIIDYINRQDEKYSVSGTVLFDHIEKEYPLLYKGKIKDAIKEMKDNYEPKYIGKFRLVETQGGHNFCPNISEKADESSM
jgi:hypothetical protein